MSGDFSWYALATRHQHERAVEAALAAHQVEAFAPTYRTRRRWSDRMQELDAPLFPGYIFGRFRAEDRARVLKTPGVVRVVGFGGIPAAVPDREIADIRMALTSQLPLQPWPNLRPGDRVRIEDGPMRGVEGVLVREKTGARLVIGVELLQRWVAVEVDQRVIVPVDAVRAALAI